MRSKSTSLPDKTLPFETTLAGRSYLKLIRRLQAGGWRVELIYLALPNAEMSRLRVAERVAHGGHSISEDDIARRFPRSLHNLFQLFSPLADQTFCFMNSDKVSKLVFSKTVSRGRCFITNFFNFCNRRLSHECSIAPNPKSEKRKRCWIVCNKLLQTPWSVSGGWDNTRCSGLAKHLSLFGEDAPVQLKAAREPSQD